MFDQFKQLKALSGLLANREEIQAKMQAFQEEMAKKSVTADAGAGAVRVTVTGKLEVQRVELDPVLLKALVGDDAARSKGLVEDLVRDAANEALQKAQEMMRDEMARVAGGMNLPGMG